MENEVLKARIEQNVREKIAIEQVKEEWKEARKKNEKMVYGLLSSCAMLILGIAIVANNKIGLDNKNKEDGKQANNKLATIEDLQKEKQEDVIKINKIAGGMSKADIAARWEDANLTKEFSFLNQIYLPESMKASRQGKIYVEANETETYENYSKFKQYCMMFANNNTYMEIEFSKEKLLQDCLPYIDKAIEDTEFSRIDNITVKILESENSKESKKIDGIAVFSYQDYNFKITVYEITSKDFIKVIKSTITSFKECCTKSIEVNEQDANVNEPTKDNESTKYPEYYAGRYVDNNGNNVVLLCEDSPNNRKEISNLLGITESKTVFKTAKNSYNYLTELQNKISKGMQDKELSFVTTSSVMEDRNKIEITVNTNNPSDWNKVKELDTIGGAIEIRYNEGEVAKEDLVVEKE